LIHFYKRKHARCWINGNLRLKNTAGMKRSRSQAAESSPLPPAKKLHSDTTTNPTDNQVKTESTKPTNVAATARVRPLKSSGSKHKSRTKRCGTCDGCTAGSCGTCQSCRINSQFSDKLKNGMAECLRKVCDSPILLTADSIKDLGPEKSKMEAMMKEQDDGACPFKLIDGQLVDFRCYICKKLPRAGMANRSELYRHYSLYHFKQELIKQFGHLTICPKCGAKKKPLGGMADHMGQVHDEVDKLLPPENRIPKKSASRAPKGGGGGKGRKRRKTEEFCFPDVPEGYDPATRTVKARPEPATSLHTSGVVVDGFVVVRRAVVELPVKPVPQPVLDLLDHKYKGYYGSCSICDGASVDLRELMKHLVGEHGMCLDAEEVGEDVIDFLVQEAEYIRVSSERIPTESDRTVEKESDTNDNEVRPGSREQVHLVDHSYASDTSRSGSRSGFLSETEQDEDDPIWDKDEGIEEQASSKDDVAVAMDNAAVAAMDNAADAKDNTAVSTKDNDAVSTIDNAAVTKDNAVIATKDNAVSTKDNTAVAKDNIAADKDKSDANEKYEKDPARNHVVEKKDVETSAIDTNDNDDNFGLDVVPAASNEYDGMKVINLTKTNGDCTQKGLVASRAALLHQYLDADTKENVQPKIM